MIFLEFEPRFTHLDTHGFDFLAAGDDTAIVAGKYDYGTGVEVGPEDAFAGNEEVVAIHEGDVTLVFHPCFS